MTPLEIAQKYVYGEHDALTDNQEIIDMTEDIKQAISEQLLLHNVSQQRELFKSFLEKVVEETEVGDLTWQTRDEAKELLKLFNCG